MAPHDLSTRALIITLKATGKSNDEITGLTGITKRTINSIFARAIERGFDSCQRPLRLKDEYLVDSSRSGRPSKQPEVLETVVNSSTRNQYISYYHMADPAQSRLQKDQTNEEAWVDEEDEEGST
ncbi:hypothetical protein EJ04DRAFT_547615 [Polyplosphaeria fusca]|uniref:Uncharacterized protein n=1 Tax=Polyplosphaeria fusca TaxID=682080 RepID=A0A9P4QK86_9PLEO|nr:hypothetical protein EJ04DRAFT_547615 [Polyplosphaeria fusca]